MRLRRRRLPPDGGDDGAPHLDDQPDGRRRRDLDRHGRTRRRTACVRQHGRRHLLPLRAAGDPRCGRGRRQHHLQAALQRRRRDDRRPAGGRALERAATDVPARCRGRRAHRRARRRHAQIRARRGLRARRAGAPTRTARRGAARAAPDERRQRARLRPDLRHRSAAQAPPRRVADADAPCLHQRGAVRRLRRLQRQVQLPVHRSGGHRVRREARHRPVHVQLRPELPRGLLPGAGDGRRARIEARAGPGAARYRPCPSRRCPRWRSPIRCSSPASAAAAS